MGMLQETPSYFAAYRAMVFVWNIARPSGGLGMPQIPMGEGEQLRSSGIFFVRLTRANRPQVGDV